jgi:hypothetical protein
MILQTRFLVIQQIAETAKIRSIPLKTAGGPRHYHGNVEARFPRLPYQITFIVPEY